MKNRSNELLRICYFGTYSMEEGYPRNRVIIEGLRKNRVEIIECHDDLWRDTSEKIEGISAGHAKTISRILLVYVRLIKKFMKVGHYNTIIVGYAGHIDIFLAKILNLFRRKPIIFDAFLSLYDTAVLDRKIVAPGSFKARLLYLLDRWACKMADVVLLDTQAHIDYFVREFRLPRDKFFAVPVGSALSVIPSQEGIPNSSPPPILLPQVGEEKGGGGEKRDFLFQVLYFGSYIPLHGVDVILKAAKILQDSTPPLNPLPQGEGKKGGEPISPPLMGGGQGEGDTRIVFTMVGTGQLLLEMKQLASDLGLKNVNFVDRFVGEEELTRYIREADICLGIFGQTDKAMRVIPCKVYNCLAMGKPLITGMTPATEGVLTHMENAFLCKLGDPEDLARAILMLKNDEILSEKIGRNGQECFLNNFSLEAIGKRVQEVIESVA